MPILIAEVFCLWNEHPVQIILLCLGKDSQCIYYTNIKDTSTSKINLYWENEKLYNLFNW